MLIDGVFSLARRVAPRAPGIRRGTFRTRVKLGPALVGTAVHPPSISRDVLCLKPDRPLDTSIASLLVESVLAEVTGRSPAPLVVVLTLEATSDIDDDGCDALVELHYRLRAGGVRLHLGGLHTDVLTRMRQAGVVNRLDPDTVWPSFRTALLSAYGELAGPAVVTRAVVAALEQRLVSLVL